VSADRVVVEVTVAAPVDVVWHALRDSAEIRRWFGLHAVTFDGGAGLLIAMRDRVILSAYGLDDTRFDALRAELTPPSRP
jgi:hypothetical protein